MIKAANNTEKGAENVLAKTIELNFGRPPTSSMIKDTLRGNTFDVKCDRTGGNLIVKEDVMKTMGDNLDPDVDVELKADYELDGHRKPEITSKIMVEADKAATEPTAGESIADIMSVYEKAGAVSAEINTDCERVD